MPNSGNYYSVEVFAQMDQWQQQMSDVMEPQVEIILNTGWVLETRPGTAYGWAWVWYEKIRVDGTLYEFPMKEKEVDHGT